MKQGGCSGETYVDRLWDWWKGEEIDDEEDREKCQEEGQCAVVMRRRGKPADTCTEAGQQQQMITSSTVFRTYESGYSRKAKKHCRRNTCPAAWQQRMPQEIWIIFRHISFNDKKEEIWEGGSCRVGAASHFGRAYSDYDQCYNFLHMISYLGFGGEWSMADFPDSHRRRRPQLHAACLIYLTIISLAQTDSCRDRCTGSRCSGVIAAPDGPIRKPQTHRTTSEGPEPHPLTSCEL